MSIDCVLFSDPGQELLDDQLCRVVVHVLGSSSSADVSEMCLDLLHGQAENGECNLEPLNFVCNNFAIPLQILYFLFTVTFHCMLQKNARSNCWKHSNSY